MSADIYLLVEHVTTYFTTQCAYFGRDNVLCISLLAFSSLKRRKQLRKEKKFKEHFQPNCSHAECSSCF